MPAIAPPPPQLQITSLSEGDSVFCLRSLIAPDMMFSITDPPCMGIFSSRDKALSFMDKHGISDFYDIENSVLKQDITVVMLDDLDVRSFISANTLRGLTRR